MSRELPRRSGSSQIEVFVCPHDHCSCRGLSPCRGGVRCNLNLERFYRLCCRVVDRDVSRQLRNWNSLISVGGEPDQCNQVSVGRGGVEATILNRRYRDAIRSGSRCDGGDGESRRVLEVDDRTVIAQHVLIVRSTSHCEVSVDLKTFTDHVAEGGHFVFSIKTLFFYRKVECRMISRPFGRGFMLGRTGLRVKSPLGRTTRSGIRGRIMVSLGRINACCRGVERLGGA